MMPAQVKSTKSESYKSNKSAKRSLGTTKGWWDVGPEVTYHQQHVTSAITGERSGGEELVMYAFLNLGLIFKVI